MKTTLTHPAKLCMHLRHEFSFDPFTTSVQPEVVSDGRDHDHTAQNMQPDPEFVVFAHLVLFIRLKKMRFSGLHFNALPHDKNLGWSKLKTVADDKIKELKMMIFVSDRVENIVGKGKNANYQYFIIFLRCFQKAVCPKSLKIGTAW